MRLFSVVFAGKKEPELVGKMPEIRKKRQLKGGDNVFLKNFGKIYKF